MRFVTSRPCSGLDSAGRRPRAPDEGRAVGGGGVGAAGLLERGEKSAGPAQTARPSVVPSARATLPPPPPAAPRGISVVQRRALPGAPRQTPQGAGSPGGAGEGSRDTEAGSAANPPSQSCDSWAREVSPLPRVGGPGMLRNLAPAAGRWPPPGCRVRERGPGARPGLVLRPPGAVRGRSQGGRAPPTAGGAGRARDTIRARRPRPPSAAGRERAGGIAAAGAGTPAQR